MLKIKLVCLGKLKEDYLKAACNEYKKRLSAFCNLEIVEIEPERLSEKPSLAQIDAALKKEAAKILSNIPERSEVFAMCIEGKQLESEAFAEKIESLPIRGVDTLCFVIGSSFGLDDSIKQKAAVKLSMSKMTFPHQLARVMLLEQLYRAFMINNHSTYHK